MLEYNRMAAVRYARKWALSRNPEYYDFSALGGDCTNFASQCIFAGARIMNYTPVFGWFYISLNDRAPAWTGVNELFKFLTAHTGAGPIGREVRLSDIAEGDIVQVKFKGGDTFAHSPVVVDRGMGTPDTVLIAAHTNDALDRPLASYAYAELRPIHILGVNG